MKRRLAHLSLFRLLRAPVCFASWLPLVCFSAEPWADRRLDPPPGLALWLDANAQNAVRRQRSEALLAAGDPVAVWYDASGNQRHVANGNPQSRPTFHSAQNLAAIRFDGEGQTLSARPTPSQCNAITVFLVAVAGRFDESGSGLLSLHRADQTDHATGMFLEHTAATSDGRPGVRVGCAGVDNDDEGIRHETSLQSWRRLCASSQCGPQGVVLYVDGDQRGTQDRVTSTICLDQVEVGARFSGDIAGARSFFAGEIAEILLFDRVLTDGERDQVDRYLAEKYRNPLPIVPFVQRKDFMPLKKVANPPLAQFFAPGFAVRKIPLELPNVNNVLYREDRKLVALAYNGDVYLLSDTDADGLEDRARLFWENDGRLVSPIGIDLTPSDYADGPGVLVAAKRECLLLVDSDADDRADVVTVVASGWPEPVHSVDALGIAFNRRDRAIFFGIGTRFYADAYDRDAEGRPKYQLAGEYGTIQRIAPNLQSRTTVATGIRFSVALRFNARGDLFCTDQEGATWLPNGNPFDELLHIDLQHKRHYGFPPRHPRYLPNVVDEPSVCDYAPQHQCACGLNFNEPHAGDETSGGKVFGPSWWRGDAIVAGYSRGKLYRTQLAFTNAGYVAQNHLLANFQTLAVDACVSPDGDLVVAAHSGGPDWGSGPAGIGQLFKVVYRNDAPIPVIAWTRRPDEVRIAFDREIDATLKSELTRSIEVVGGPYVAAGDRFEGVRPGYAIVDRQMRAPRFAQRVVAAQLTTDRRTLVVTTAPHRAAVHYSVSLPFPSPHNQAAPADALPQSPAVDLAYDLSGVEAVWQPSEADIPWTSWLPHLDLEAARQLTRASADHDTLWRLIKRKGTLTLRTQLRLDKMLHPVIQPGASIDFEYPPEHVDLQLTSNSPIDVVWDGNIVPAKRRNDTWICVCSTDPTERAARPHDALTDKKRDAAEWYHRLEIRIHRTTIDTPMRLEVSYRTNEDARLRPLPRQRMAMPWAEAGVDLPESIDNRDLPELVGGDWQRGKDVFFSAQAACSKCHAIRGEGAQLAPNLSNLPQRDYASVLRDISDPSFTINPDFVTQIVESSDGRVYTGTVRADDKQIWVADAQGQEILLERGEVESVSAASTSIMPQGIPSALGPEKLRDLLTFLLNEPPTSPEGL